MSSTNRGSTRELSDYYTTPIEDVETFLREWAKNNELCAGLKRIFDPCAGGTLTEGKLVTPMSYPEAFRICADIFPEIKGDIETMDIRGDSPADIIRDYLTTPPLNQPDLIITNPPFALALPVIQKALQHVRPGGFVVMLLRLNFFGADKRKAWLQANMPARCYVHSKRMGFLKHRLDLPPKERNATDSIEYAHFVWRQGQHPSETLLRVI